MNKKFLLTILFLIIGSVFFCASAQQAFTIEDVIVRAKGQSIASKQNDTRKENGYWRYRYYKTNFNPQLRLTGVFPGYDKFVTPVLQPDGTYRYLPVEQMRNNIGLGLQQPVLWTGGTISANSSLAYFKNYNPESGFPKQWSGSVMNIALRQPLFSFNDLKWQKKIEPLIYEESRKSFVEQMEVISGEAVGRFFTVLTEQINLQIAQFNLANNDTIYKIEQGRYNIGTTSQDKLLQVELQLLRSKQDVASANLNLETARLYFRYYIGLNDTDEFPQLVLPETIPDFEVSEQEALDYAKKNRAAYISFERQRLEADQLVARTRGNRFNVMARAAYGLNNNGLVLNDVYINPKQQQQVSLTFDVPILDWGRNKSRMRTAIANKKVTDYTIAQDENNFEQTVTTKARQFQMLKLQVEISKKSDEVATLRYNVAQNRYLIGKIDITNLNIALNEKDAAKRSYIGALQQFWTAYYELRRLTLYDFASRKQLYTEED